MIYLTAIGLTSGGSSTHLRTKYIEQHKQTIYEQHIIVTKQYTEQYNSRIRKSADRVPYLRGIPWHLPYNWGKRTENLSQGSRMKKEYTE
jgi:hypothetical protein